MRHLPLLLAGVAALLGATTARAQSSALSRALEAYERGALTEAASAFDEALRAGDNDAAALATIHMHRGILHAAMGEEREADAAFALAVALDPTLETPEELPPDQAARFRRAREAREGRPITVHIEPSPDGASVGVLLRGAPEGAVTTVRVTLGDGGVTEWLDPPGGAVPWGPPGPRAASAVALDGHGNVLAHAEAGAPSGRSVPAPSEAAAAALEDEREGQVTATTAEDEDGGTIWSSPWLWTGVGIVVLGGIVAALVITSDHPGFGPSEIVNE